jgi:type II secretory pathway pseudopilin PulG
MNTHSQQAGFILVKVAIGMIVAGFLIVAVLNTFSREDERRMRIKNEEKMNVITDALARFVHENGRFPCPASILIDPGEVDFGVEQCAPMPPNSSPNGRMYARYNSSAVGVTRKVYVGSVPVTTLKLPYHYIVDVYQGRYTYAVSDVQMTSYVPGNGEVIIRSPTDYIKLNADFVLVSHGPDKKGAHNLRNNNSLPGGGDRVGPAALRCQAVGSPIGSTNTRSGIALDHNNCFEAGSSVHLNELMTYIDAPYSPQNDIWDENHYDDQIVYSLGFKDTALWDVRENERSQETDITLKNPATSIGIGGDPTGNRVFVEGDVEIHSDQNGSTTNCNDDGSEPVDLEDVLDDMLDPCATNWSFIIDSNTGQSINSQSGITGDNIRVNGDAVGILYAN